MVALRMLDACFGRPAPDAPGLEPFQAHALHRLHDIIQRRGGALLADSVGLGKTHVAAALIRDELAAGGTAVVTAPAQLRAHWKRHLRGMARVRWISHASLSRGARSGAPATLVVVDEAHAFRNPRTRRYAALAVLCEASRVLLVTATPVNNSLLDFYHLVRLFAPRDLFTDIGVPDLLAAVESAARRGTSAELRRVADAVMVRRTRGALGAGSLTGGERLLRFPRSGPIEVLSYDMSPALVECVQRVVPSLSFVAHDLGGHGAPRELMRLGLLKRLESSTPAFHASVRRHMRLLDQFIAAANDGLLFDPRRDRALDTDVDGAVQLSLRAVTLVPWPRSFDRERSTAAAMHDLALLRELDAVLRDVGTCAAGRAAGRAKSGPEGRPNGRREGRAEDYAGGKAECVTDAKLSRLTTFLDGVDDKVLIFTEYQDTARALWRALSRRTGTALVHGSDARLGCNRSSRRAVIERFAPIANHARVPRTVERVRVLITTDVLAEGLNLQDAGVLVSYDLPWNPVRLAQRIGRIDRLGSPHPHIRVATFVPDRGIDDLLGLMQRIRRKLRHIRIVGGDAPWSLAGRRRAARVVDEIDTAGDARERAYALWRSCSAHARPDAAGTPVAVTYWNGEHSAALCCVRAGGEALLILIPDDAPVQVATGACWTALVETLEAAASDAAAIDATHVEIAGVAARVHAAQQAVRKALRRRRAQAPASLSAADLGSARAIVLRWLAGRPGGPTDEELEAADSALRTLGEQRRAGTEIRVSDILRSGRSAEATVAALRSLAPAASTGPVATPVPADIQAAGARRRNTIELAGVLLLRCRDPT